MSGYVQRMVNYGLSPWSLGQFSIQPPIFKNSQCTPPEVSISLNVSIFSQNALNSNFFVSNMSSTVIPANHEQWFRNHCWGHFGKKKIESAYIERNWNFGGVHYEFLNIGGRIENRPKLQGGNPYFSLRLKWFYSLLFWVILVTPHPNNTQYYPFLAPRNQTS